MLTEPVPPSTHTHLPFGVVAMAASWGGVKAVGDVLSGLPPHFPAAVLIVQHRPPDLPGLLDQILGRRTRLAVKEAEDGEALRVGTVYLAPADRHMLLGVDGMLRLTQTPKVNSARPAADPLFESVADHFEGQVVAVVLTGTGSDGSRGVEAVKRMGGCVIVQDAATAEAAGMPLNAVMTGAADMVLLLAEIAPALVKLLEKQATSAGGGFQLSS